MELWDVSEVGRTLLKQKVANGRSKLVEAQAPATHRPSLRHGTTCLVGIRGLMLSWRCPSPPLFPRRPSTPPLHDPSTFSAPPSRPRAHRPSTCSPPETPRRIIYSYGCVHEHVLEAGVEEGSPDIDSRFGMLMLPSHLLELFRAASPWAPANPCGQDNAGKTTLLYRLKVCFAIWPHRALKNRQSSSVSVRPRRSALIGRTHRSEKSSRRYRQSDSTLRASHTRT